MGMKYKDEEDKCYGIAGMTIGIAVCNGEDMLYRLDIDDETNGYITFTSDYYYSGNPALPAKESWELTLKHFQMTIGMLMANMMCRSLHKSDSHSTTQKVTVQDRRRRGQARMPTGRRRNKPSV